MASLRNEVVCQEDDIRSYIPDPPGGLLGFDDSVRLALKRVKDADVATRWSDAYMPGAPSDPMPTDPDWAGGSLFTDDRSTRRGRLAGGPVGGGRVDRRGQRLVLAEVGLGDPRRDSTG